MIRKIVKIDSIDKVFIVGDIHGEITKLNDKLKEVGFNKEFDHLISVGDLIDRGEDSHACLNLVDESWFDCVRGNHEQMAYDAITGGTRELEDHWYMNGGDWYYNSLTCEKNDIAGDVKRHVEFMPHVIELHYRDKVTIICHADWGSNYYHTDMEMPEINLLWSRDRVSEMKRTGDYSRIVGADLFVFGHTPMRSPLHVANQLYIDTGACFGKELTVLNLSDKLNGS